MLIDDSKISDPIGIGMWTSQPNPGSAKSILARSNLWKITKSNHLPKKIIIIKRKKCAGLADDQRIAVFGLSRSTSHCRIPPFRNWFRLVWTAHLITAGRLRSRSTVETPLDDNSSAQIFMAASRSVFNRALKIRKHAERNYSFQSSVETEQIRCIWEQMHMVLPASYSIIQTRST